MHTNDTDGAAGLRQFLSLDPAHGREAEGTCLPGGLGNAFGGSILAHMIHTSTQEVPDEFSLQSVHAHFHAVATIGAPLEYRLTKLQRSRRFASLGIMATQQERIVASGTVTHHVDEQTSQHTTPQPEGWSAPEASEQAQGRICPSPEMLLRQPFDIRRATSTARQERDGRPMLGLWIRALEPLTGWHEIHKAALAWVSDFSLTRVADLGHEDEPGKWFAATLNHAMWFHRSVDLNEWVFYELHSPSYHAGIAHSSGRFFNQNNELIASASQDCVVRRLMASDSDTRGRKA